MKPARDTAIAIPPTLVAKIRNAANEENRSAADVLYDALELYLEARQWRRHSDHESACARALGLPDDEAVSTTEYRHNIREKIAQGLRSLREGESTDGEAFFAQLDAEFEELERQGHK
jgi:antitoxin ParD1/3/4